MSTIVILALSGLVLACFGVILWQARKAGRDAERLEQTKHDAEVLHEQVEAAVAGDCSDDELVDWLRGQERK